jgi:hypothetical protein
VGNWWKEGIFKVIFPSIKGDGGVKNIEKILRNFTEIDRNLKRKHFQF